MKIGGETLKRFISCILLFLLLLVGCSNNVEKAEETWKVSPTFSTDYGEMFGKEGKIGIIGGEVKAGKGQKWMWHFWGSEDISYKEWEVKAVHQDTNKEINPILFKDEKLTPKDKEIQGHARSQVSFPSPGLWKIKVFIDNKFFDEFVVEVKN
jgi:Domain of unknown function (DUF4871)